MEQRVFSFNSMCPGHIANTAMVVYGDLEGRSADFGDPARVTATLHNALGRLLAMFAKYPTDLSGGIAPIVDLIHDHMNVEVDSAEGFVFRLEVNVYGKEAFHQFDAPGDEAL
ncbi:MAG TPA: hypothetical protein VMU27_02025 [Candidatus Paceibacterota bacterium]|nr:hypothetical protein [Candidatus Paceibacterota bacterium]